MAAAAPPPPRPCLRLPLPPPPRPGTRVAVMERTAPRPRGAVVGVPPNGVRALEAISPELRAAVGAHHLGARTFMRCGGRWLISLFWGWGWG